jgi:hypothetical protein
LLLKDLGWGFIAMALNNPLLVMKALKKAKSLAQFLHSGEVLHSKQIFLEDSDKALGAAIVFWSPDKSRRTGNTQESDFFLSNSLAN